MTINADVEVDTNGLRCPEPLMVVRNKMMDLTSGQVMKIVATDPSTTRDFPQYCRFLQHEMLHQETIGTEYTYWIKKG